MISTYLSLGSNQGDRLESLVKASKLIDLQIGNIIKFSPVFESEPWGFEAETSFYNMVIEVETKLTSHQLLSAILQIEKSLGRVRSGKEYSSRIIDIDIIFYGDRIVKDENLKIPHPKMHLRKFVLEPMVDIAPDFVHPFLHKSIAELLADSVDENVVEIAVSKDEFARLFEEIN
jgi:2-amino-4-hydroxy-6-hydroxymethyldihydropteridine diphosphokinase